MAGHQSVVTVDPADPERSAGLDLGRMDHEEFQEGARPVIRERTDGTGGPDPQPGPRRRLWPRPVRPSGRTVAFHSRSRSAGRASSGVWTLTRSAARLALDEIEAKSAPPPAQPERGDAPRGGSTGSGLADDGVSRDRRAGERKQRAVRPSHGRDRAPGLLA